MLVLKCYDLIDPEHFTPIWAASNGQFCILLSDYILSFFAMNLIVPQKGQVLLPLTILLRQKLVISVV